MEYTQGFNLDSAALVMTIVAQIVALGMAFGAFRETVRRLREIADATISRLATLETRVDIVEDRTSRIEVGCKLRHKG